MVWGSMPKLGTAPPMGREISQIHFFAYNFLLVCQKIMFLGSMDSLGHAESEDVHFARLAEARVRHFEICHELQYLLNHLTYRYKNR